MWKRHSVILFVVAGLLATPVMAADQKPAAPVAIVSYVEGTSEFRPQPTAPPQPLKLFARLAEGARVETSKNARVVLAFVDGRRFELGARARATVGASGLTERKGPIKALASVPVMPEVAPIAGQMRATSRAGAVRVRGGGHRSAEISDLRPSNGATVAADEVRLSFAPAAGVARYRVVVEDELGNVVLSLETENSTVMISSGVLKPEAAYFWEVRSLGSGFGSRGEAMFVTIKSREQYVRNELRKAANDGHDAGLWLLSAEYDRSIGLQDQACATLDQVLRRHPANVEIQSLAVDSGCGAE